MQEILVVVDMQNDFVTGPLGTPEARTILPKVAEKVKNFPGRVLFTRDTHEENYLESREGKALPVPHCIRGTRGWEICPELETLRKEEPVDKPTFGSTGLGEVLRAADQYGEKIGKITLVGVCTDICVISNALLLRAFLPEAEIAVDAACCAGVTPESHQTALRAMKACQITIENE
ncbi:MAG TPA: cysteine hydrolase [Candidatus Faecivivens stercoravium]|uniref:Cysteine hydrolase n=1 Tax=Candidatus Faecivivens stercoravium TaxID=2840803 RepID=A0A9D1DW39_9FIRM|nr:cysteine hydrolase [Candidatus Faecivivens stercoravium]